MKLKSLLLTLFGLALLLACSNNSKPKDLLTPDVFEAILVDIHLSDAILSEQRKSVTELYNLSPSYYHFIYNKYKVSREQFDASILYYSYDTDDIEKIYDNVVAKIQELQRANVAQEIETPAKL
jgi:hypothetical protein